MKLFIFAITIFLVMMVVSNLNAAKVYTWTDEKGKLHISEEPPPENARIKDVINYQPRSDEAGKGSAPLPEEADDGRLIERRQQEARNAREQAEKAAREAQEAQTKANQATKEANEYIQTHNRNQYMRRAHKHEMRKASDKAKAAQEQARAATEKARQAEKRARAAEEQAKEAAALPSN